MEEGITKNVYEVVKIVTIFSLRNERKLIPSYEVINMNECVIV